MRVATARACPVRKQKRGSRLKNATESTVPHLLRRKEFDTCADLTRRSYSTPQCIAPILSTV
ncbi:uncharacterized protein MYCGRDRAFT_104099 [Zymoseptoria tritici IPO323]|uniref:Uncharacterized protein n=1 Tax=Zymoseptoria tritici (strain CBS 115943 / IPO323) TaxID=336722 RepID=F9X8D5_ZYMTI|nr:uncharacterized protein MYCGRDRAFT_104099 [Zymoseptoria tritici IPO323]EGP87899.1 hypothetical protein MYCGRDRAFT_104099 [Zymoseptoria tritici IPO323]